jgi:hypothetical protein
MRKCDLTGIGGGREKGGDLESVGPSPELGITGNRLFTPRLIGLGVSVVLSLSGLINSEVGAGSERNPRTLFHHHFQAQELGLVAYSLDIF